MTTAPTTERRARRERDARRRQRGFTLVDAIKPLVNTLPLTEVLSPEGVDKIHRASMRLLKEIGILIVDYPRAAETFRRHGAIVEERSDGQLVKIDEDTLLYFVRQAPSSFVQRARNPAKDVPIGGRHTVFAPVYGPPFVLDLDHGRRQATIEDFRNFVRLTYLSEHLHHDGGTLCEPNDVDVKERHLDMLLAHITLSDKAFMGSVTHKENARDTVAMAEIVFGAEAIRERPAVLSLINASSPLRFDDRMFGALEVYAQAKQALLITPFLIAGAMSPVSMAATLAQQNAEALFGICYAQMLNPGTPCIYGSFLANIDLKSGAPCFGTPEGNLALYAGAQMARHYNLPYRSGGNFTASRIPDAQAGYESASTFTTTVQAGVNFVLHAAGWLEGGLIAGYEKFILDLEMCGMMAKFVQGIGLDEEDFAWDAYEEVGPGSHFLGSQHTMRHYETAFYQHAVFNMDNYEKWESEGAEDAYKRANAVWKRMLQEYQPPALDAGVEEALREFVEKRRAEIRAGRLVRE
ncbi:MAG: trimethylamine methyltransferase family protein [Candidatus Brachytrichaceae bacterium NZ_4S206]|jgi:trimethylamine--corrinoid protein Co-methyltransferase